MFCLNFAVIYIKAHFDGSHGTAMVQVILTPGRRQYDRHIPN